ncbi:MAG: substrate-binding domain-containing protein [Marinobacter sp.]|uniref:substrate-binding domain-containing protein n=1 Tax=Marinobacter sp. TaxID=50741 RepID=UPI00349FD620
MISPIWSFSTEEGQLFEPVMFVLLRSIRETGRLTAAASASDISYRHAWNLLNKWSDFFGLPLVVRRKGQGTTLSPLGEKLVWSHERVQARLGPQIDSMASELNMQMQQLLEGTHQVLRMQASHGFAVALLPKFQARFELNLQYSSPEEALISLNRGESDVAGFHLPTDPLFAHRVLEHYRDLLPPDKIRVIRFITRRQGLMIRSESKTGITGLPDLMHSGHRFINRERRSDTRALFNMLLERESISGQQINGFDSEEFTHSAVAAYVAAGMADAGFGVEAAARQFDLDFVPLTTEYYLLLCHRDRLGNDNLKQFLQLIRSDDFVAEVNKLPGYFPDLCGEVFTLAELLESYSKTKSAKYLTDSEV